MRQLHARHVESQVEVSKHVHANVSRIGTGAIGSPRGEHLPGRASTGLSQRSGRRRALEQVGICATEADVARSPDASVSLIPLLLPGPASRLECIRQKGDGPTSCRMSPIPFLSRGFRALQRRGSWLPSLGRISCRRPTHSCGAAPDFRRLPPSDLVSSPMLTAAASVQLFREKHEK